MKGKFFKKNSSVILTCIGAVGMVATVITAVKATPKAVKLIEEAEKDKGEELTKIEKVKTAGSVYIPSIIIGTSSLVCIFGATILSKKSQATLMSSYALLDKSYKEYRKKAKDLIVDVDDDSSIEDDLNDEVENVITIFDSTTLSTFETTLNQITLDDGMKMYVIETPMDYILPY